LVALRVIHGSATALFGPAASAALSDLAPSEQRGQWLSLYSATQGAGQALGPVLAASLIVGGDFSAVFVVSALVGSAALVLLLQWPRTAARAPAGAVWSRLRDGLHATAADNRVLVTSLAQAGQFFVNGTLAAFLPLYAHESLGLAPSRIGWVFGLQTLATLVARPLFGVLSDRVGRRPLIVAGLTTCAACMAAIPYAGDFTSLVAVTMAYGTGLAITTSATSAFVTDLTRRARYGAAHGLFGTIYDIGDALGPIFAGLVVARTGYVSAFQLTGVVAIIIALTFARFSRHWEADDRACSPVFP
jgi:MFS family permease